MSLRESVAPILAALALAALCLVAAPASADGPAEWAAGGPGPGHAARAYPKYAQQQSTSPIKFIGAAALARRLEQGAKPILVDVRTGPEYEKAHLPNAVSIPLDELAARLSEIPRMGLVVLY